ncbi:MAG: hypothetical protein MJZ66_00565 [Bacteroidales bacterium]|nr:hypothetical protein [Bacteroidales bacterium]
MTTAANIQYNYDLIRTMVLNMPKEDRDRLRREVYDESEDYSCACREPEFPFFGPKTAEEALERLQRAEQDYREGRCRPIEEFFKEMEEKYPWLSE